MIRKPAFCIALACLLAASATGAANLPAAATVDSAATASPAHHFLWRISKAHETLYLVGSIHALNPDDYPLPVEMETGFRNSAALVEELDLTSVNPYAMQQDAIRLGLYPPNQSLRTELPPAVYQQVATAAGTLGIDMTKLERLRPWLGSLTILGTQLAKLGYSPSDGVDHHFADEAQISHKRVIGLETPAFQLQLLAHLPAQVQQDMLLESLNEAGHFSQELQALVSAWENGDTATLGKILQQEFGPYPQAYQLLIAARNRAWLPRLESLMEDGQPYFVVVGALHLVGPDGLLAGFEKAGYKVEQL